MFFSVHGVLVFVFCTVVAVKVLTTLLWPGPKKYVKREYFVNTLLGNVRQVIDKIGEDCITVPDIVISIPSDIPGQFWATSGWARNMTTFQRLDKDIILEVNNNVEKVEFYSRLKHVQITFNHFKVNLSNTQHYGTINTYIDKNLFRIKLHVNFLTTGNCTTTLNKLVLEEFSGVHVNVTGIEDDSELNNKIQKWVADDILILVRHRIEEYFNKVFSYILPNQDYCINKPDLDDDDY